MRDNLQSSPTYNDVLSRENIWLLFLAALSTLCVSCMSHFTFPALVFISKLGYSDQPAMKTRWVHMLWCKISILEIRGSLNTKCSIIMSFPQHAHFPLCQCAFFEKCGEEIDDWIITSIGAKALLVEDVLVQQTSTSAFRT